MSYSVVCSLERAAMMEVMLRQIIQWEILEDNKIQEVIDRIDKLETTHIIKNKMNDVVYPVIEHLEEATNFFHKRAPNTPIGSIKNCMRLSAWGNVDIKRSAEELVGLSDEELPGLERHGITMAFCMDDTSTFHGSRPSFYANDDFPSPRQRVGCPQYEYAVMDGNAVAAKHFWREDAYLPFTYQEMLMQHSTKISVYPRRISDLYTFLFYIQPNDEALRKALLWSKQFVLSILVWPYHDVLLKILLKSNESQIPRWFTFLTEHVFLSYIYQMRNHHNFINWKHFVKGLLESNDALRREGSNVIFKSTMIILTMDKLEEFDWTYCLKLMMNLLSNEERVKCCREMSHSATLLLRNEKLNRLASLFSSCGLSYEELSTIKEDMFKASNYHQILHDPMYQFNNLIESQLREFVSFCSSSSERFEEMMQEINSHRL